MLVTLLLPALHLSHEDVSALNKEVLQQVPTLTKWLKRGESQLGGEFLYRRLAEVCGFANHDLPLGAVMAAHKGVESAHSGYWLCVSPVALKASQSGVYCLGSDQLNLTEQEAASLINSLNIFLQDDMIRIFPGQLTEWYMRVQGEHHITTTMLSDMVGKDMRFGLPKGASVGVLEGLLSEIQMLFHQHPVNIERRAKGLPTVDGLWAFGAGHYPNKVEWPWDYAMSNHEGVCALAKAAKKPCEPLKSFTEIKDQEISSLLILDCRLEQAALAANKAAWLKGLSEIETRWLKPLDKAMKAKRVTAVELLGGEGRSLYITRKDLLYFWRNRSSLEYWLCA